MTAFHETTTTILKYILDEQRRDLSLAQRRLDKADETTLKTDAERERFPRTVETFRNQIAELTDVVADFERLIQHVADANTTDSTVEAFVDVADAEHYVQRDEYVNADVHVPCICHTDPNACRAFGRREELDATDDGREPDDVYAEGEREAEEARLAEENEAEYFGAPDAERWAEENAANQYGVEHFDAAEAADVARIEHEMAIEAGMECDPDTCAYCGGAS